MSVDIEGIRFATVAVVDTNGLLRGQKVSGAGLKGILENGMGMAPAQLALDPTDAILEIPGVTDETADFHDSVLKVDKSSRRTLPWEAPTDSAFYLSQFTGDAAGFCPRTVLASVLAQCAKDGFTFKYGLEQEFTLFNETSQTLENKGFDGLETATRHASHDLVIYQTLQSDLYAEIADMADTLGLKIGKMHEEIGGGFMEVCIDAGTGLEPADQVVLLKNFLRVLAMKRGQSISYMPRWSDEADSQSTHLHVSLLDQDQKPIFYDADGFGEMSDRMRHFVGGLQTFLPEMMLLFAPTVNGWRRFAEGTFAPPAFTWGIENRTTCFRVVGDSAGAKRVENRLPCADSNPYFSAAATLAAGLAGMRDGIDPTAPTVGNGYVPGVGEGVLLHGSMTEAVDAFHQSEFARKWLGERLVETFCASRRQQIAQFEGKTLIDERHRFFELG